MIQFNNFIFIVANAIFKICIHGIKPLLKFYILPIVLKVCHFICTFKLLRSFSNTTDLLASDTKRKKGKMKL